MPDAGALFVTLALNAKVNWRDLQESVGLQSELQRKKKEEKKEEKITQFVKVSRDLAKLSHLPTFFSTD